MPTDAGPPAFDRLMLDFRGAAVDGPVTSGLLFAVDGQTPVADPRALKADSIGRRVVLLVHGFNVDRPGGLASLGSFMELLAPRLEGALLIGVLWPGDSRFGFLSYSFEGKDADDTARKLARWIGDHLDASASLSLVAHSKGCRVVMRAIDHLVAADAPQAVDEVCLLAAAIDRTSLSDPDRKAYARATRHTTRVTVLSSINDAVLQFAYPAGDLLQGWLYSRRDEPGFALGLTGPAHGPNAEADARKLIFGEPIPKARRFDHGDYLPGTAPPDPRAAQVAAFVATALAGKPDPRFA